MSKLSFQYLIWGRGGAKPCVYVCKHTYARGVFRHSPQENVLSEIITDVAHSQGLRSEERNDNLEAAIKLEGGASSPNINP